MVIAQLTGILALLAGLATFLAKSDRQLRLNMTLYAALMSAHFFLLGVIPAGFSEALNACRSAVSAFTKRKRFFILFLLTSLLISFQTYSALYQLLPAISSVLTSVALFFCHGIRARLILALATTLWIWHNLIVQSLGGIFIETSFLIANFYGIYKVYTTGLLQPIAVKNHQNDKG
ncbi:YgjV family protein [Serratia plymuthica]|uniref:YgjV family protein n=1 Tax=Enterobacterales TaxID=91347 RepID=UPI0023A9EDFF|nr:MULTISPECIES: YgjV family protein [Enterobacterales]MDD9640741.1 YgjV family protein [Klebsiella michiganensis]MEB6540932.1 YgjV family protein [Serratia plymuthica]